MMSMCGDTEDSLSFLTELNRTNTLCILGSKLYMHLMTPQRSAMADESVIALMT